MDDLSLMVSNTYQSIGNNEVVNYVLCTVDCDHNSWIWHIYDDSASQFSAELLATQRD